MNHSYLIVFWSPSSIISSDLCIGYFSSCFQKYGDIQCLDCKNDQGNRTLRLIRQADLVVISLRQDEEKLFRRLCEGTLRVSNYIFLIPDYIPDPEYNLSKIAFTWRIPPNRLACIPYHPMLREGFKKPALPGQNHVLCAGGSDLRRELALSARKMLQALGF